MDETSAKSLDSSDPKKPRSRASWVILVVTFLIAVCWLLVLSWLTKQSQQCTLMLTSPKPDIIAGFLPCLSPNEVGDWLAGGFAPLAFIGLMAAVLLQSFELGAQRQELSDTREVFKDQTKLLRLQIHEAERSGNLFEQQTEILKDEQLSRKKSENHDVILKLSEKLGAIPGIRITWKSDRDENDQLRSSQFWQEAKVSGKTDTLSIKKLTKFIQKLEDDFKQANKKCIDPSIDGIDNLKHIYSILQLLPDIDVDVSEIDKLVLQEIDAPEKMPALLDLLSRAKLFEAEITTVNKA